MISPTISYLTDVYFAPGSITILPELLSSLDVSRPMVVTDAGLVDLGMPDRIGIEEATLFSDVPTNPTERSVLAGLQRYRQSDCDGIVALGGGSPMDCAKAIALLVTHPQPLEQYALIRGGIGNITADKPVVIAIPTTAGTGSEVGRASLITFNETTKLAIVGKPMIPNAAICDPELTLELPPQLTAATGMDAISHCVETFCSPKFNPVADAIALDGLQRACANLREAVANGSNLDARIEMMMASTQGALAFQKGLGMIHSLSHPLGALEKRLHHGTLNAIFLPHVLRFNAEACPEKMNRMAAATGAADGEELAQFFKQLSIDIGLPTRLSELGVTSEDLAPMAEPAVADHSTATNPREFGIDDAREMLELAM